MTCIVGIIEKGKVYIGGDSLGTHSQTMDTHIRSDQKVFRKGAMILGFTTSFRMGQLLQSVWEPPDHPVRTKDFDYLVGYVIPSIINLYDEHKYGNSNGENGAEGGEFLLGYNGRLYHIFGDFQVAIPSDGIAACGSGGRIALGALYATKGNPIKRLRKALQISAHLNGAVGAPFKIISEK